MTASKRAALLRVAHLALLGLFSLCSDGDWLDYPLETQLK